VAGLCQEQTSKKLAKYLQENMDFKKLGDAIEK
jgi:hypothetical protein